MPFENVVGPGGLLTTVSDWLIWNEALANRTLGAAWVDSLTRRMTLTGGREAGYALGLFVTSYRGVSELSHSGSTAGYSTFLARYPDRGNLSIAVLCNSTRGDAGAYAHRLADRLIPDFPPPPALDTARVDSASFARWAGVYRNDRYGAPLVVDARTAARLRVLPGGWYWGPNGTRWLFETGADGKPAGLRLAQPDGDTVHFSYAADRPWTPTHEQLQAFEGTYRSDEVGTTYVLKVAGDTLTLSPRVGMVLALRPAYPDAFTVRGGVVRFTRDRRGAVTAMHTSDSRVWDLVVPRVR